LKHKNQNRSRHSGQRLENDIVIGNVYDKYGSSNPIVKRLMSAYSASLTKLIKKANADSIHEVGCGEGYWTLKWLENGIDARGSDFSENIIKTAKRNAKEKNLPENKFSVRNIYDLDPSTDSANLIVCAEVLEHLDNPERALMSLTKVVGSFLIVCVPREPIWSVLNMARGKYWRDWGNTPGHIQRWSKSGFIGFIGKQFDIIDVETPLPWTMLLCKQKNNRR